MKLLFLHLSDMHLKEDTILKKIDATAIANAVNQIGNFDECMLIFSGDITQAGKKNEYVNAGKLIGRIAKDISLKYLNGKKIETMLVPGNHDVLMKNPERNGAEIQSYYDEKKVVSMYNKDIECLDNFYEFANRNGCFRHQKVIDIRIINYNGFKVKVNLINTTPFSLCGSTNADKGMHYLSEQELFRLTDSRDEKYTITVMHHGPEWFNDEAKRTLYNYLNSSTDLFFVGHEHFSLNEHKSVNGKMLDVSSGLSLYGDNTEHGFNAWILDTEENNLEGYKCIKKDRIYKPEKNVKNNNIQFSCNKNFKLTSEFREELLLDGNERRGEKYLQYFVFPSLELKDTNKENSVSTISSVEKFEEVLVNNKKISIEGGSRSGKSILAKYLTYHLSEKYIVLYLTEDSFTPKSIKNILKNSIESQFGNQADYDEFLQLTQNSKVLIVDGSDKVDKEKWDVFYETYGNSFEHIILLSGINWNLNIKEKTEEELTDSAFLYYKICPFYYVKREELIRKICTNYYEKSSKDEIAEKSNKINEDITNQIKFFQLTPDFIHQFVDYYIQFSHIKAQKETNVFSKVFVANITYRISNHTRDDSDVDEIMVALDYVAHYIHFIKQYQKISYGEFEDAINEYKKKYDNEELKPKYVFDVALKANIIKEVSDSFDVEFCDENLLAYFVAQHLNRTCQNGENPEELKHVLDNICFGINGDVLLFLSYITSNTQILAPILSSLVAHMSSWAELDLDSNNISYLKDIKTQTRTKIPDHKEKAELKEKKNEHEREIVEKKQNQSDSLYSYDASKVNSFSNKIVKSINYLDLVSKILPNFRYILTGDEKKKIVEVLYAYPNKLLYFMLKDIDANHDKIIKDILKNEPKTGTGILITEDMISRELQFQSIAYILSIYDFISTAAANEKTINDFEKYDYTQNTNYRIQNLLMNENVANFNAFASRAKNIYDNADLNITKQMVKLVVRKYFLYHDVDMHGEAISLIDKIFGKEQRKKMELIQAKNRIVKK